MTKKYKMKIKKNKSNKKDELSKKVARIMKEGVRRNTHAPLSRTNKRRPVKINQAVAIAKSMMDQNRKMEENHKRMKKRRYA